MEWITSIDFAILDGIQKLMRCEFWDAVMKILSYLGEAGAVWIILGIVLLFFRKTRVAGIAVLASVALCFISGELIIKNIVARPRPFQEHQIVMNIRPPHGFSFPSAHSSLSFSAATCLTVYFRKFGIPALVLAALIAFSRLYNFVHYPSDVICGIILGILCALFVCWAIRKTGIENRLGAKKHQN